MPVDPEHDQPGNELIPLLIELQLNLDGEINLASLARQYGYSPFHFHRYFSKSLQETPKRHVDRLRLERAAYKLAITRETILEIALSVGFQNHETFSRSFRRTFGCAPGDYRKACREAQAKRLERNRGFRGDGCHLSEVRFVSLPAMTLLAMRSLGAYAEYPAPFTDQDKTWNGLIDHAQRIQVACHRLAIAISYDDPTLTPPALQRLDACIPIAGEIALRGRIHCLRFPGGRYGAVEHTGPLTTIDQAYRNVADGIRRSATYDFGEAPPIQIFRHVHIGGDPAANRTEVYFPVRTVQAKAAPN